MIRNLLKAAVGAVLLPLDIAADIVTLGGSLTDRNESFTVRRAEHISRNLDAATNPKGQPHD